MQNKKIVCNLIFERDDDQQNHIGKLIRRIKRDAKVYSFSFSYSLFSNNMNKHETKRK